MARLESTATLRESGWSLTMLREGDDFKTFTEEILEEMRAGAETRMARAQNHIVAAIKRTLGKRYPKGQSAPSGAPPGTITGELADSWKTRKPTWKEQKTILTGRYFSRHPAAGPLEFGDPGRKSKRRLALHTVFRSARAAAGMAAHPYIRPTLVREAPTLDAILDGRLE